MSIEIFQVWMDLPGLFELILRLLVNDKPDSFGFECPFFHIGNGLQVQDSLSHWRERIHTTVGRVGDKTLRQCPFKIEGWQVTKFAGVDDDIAFLQPVLEALN